MDKATMQPDRDENNREAYRAIYKAGMELLRYPDEILVSYAYQTLRRDLAVSTVLDAGCGAGRHVHLFASMGFDAYGLDPSPDALAFAVDRLEADGLPGTLDCAPCSAIPQPDATFDVVLCWGVINTIVEDAEMTASMNEMLRVLRPGGRLLISLSSREDAKYHGAEKHSDNTYRIKYQGADYFCRFWDKDEALDFLRGYGLEIEQAGYVLRCVNFDADQPVAYHVVACRKPE